MAALLTPRVVPVRGAVPGPHGPIVLSRSLNTPVLPISRMLGIDWLDGLN